MMAEALIPQTQEQFPRRYLVYMAGISTRLLLPVIQEFVSRLGQQIDTVIFVIGDRRSYRWARTQPLDPRIELLYQHERVDPFRRPTRVPEAKLTEWEERYGIPHLWRYILIDRMVQHLSYEARLAYLQTYLNYFEEVSQQYRPEVLITGAPDSMLFLLAYAVIARNGAIPLLLTPGRLRGRSFIVDNECERIPGLGEVYADIKTRDLTLEERHEARTVIDSYLTHHVRPHYFGLGPRLRPVPSLTKLLQRVKGWVFEDDRFFDVVLWQTIQQSIAARWKTPWQQHALRRYAMPAIDETPFFYYPLHYEPESTVDVFSTFYRNQLQAIALVAAALPTGYRLYVKENPNMCVGTRSGDYYHRLSAIPSVRILPMHMDSYEIIQRCRGVITLSGTTGFEALCCGKPVMMFGHAFYEVFAEGVFRPLRGIDEVAWALQQMTQLSCVNEELLEKFIVAVLQRTYPAEYEQYRPEVEGVENVQTLSVSLIRELYFRLRSGVPQGVVT